MHDLLVEERTMRDLLHPATPPHALERYLQHRSGSPGPQTNHLLADTFATQIALFDQQTVPWALLWNWAGIPPAVAGSGSAREVLPVCAVQALAALYPNADGPRQAAIFSQLQRTADDSRRRVREAVVLALQRLLRRDRSQGMAMVRAWLPVASPRGLRAILVALAQPELLPDAAAVQEALQVADAILTRVGEMPARDRCSDDFRILRQGLDSTLSLLVAAQPETGFAWLRRWAACDDPVIKRILRANLGMARLHKAHSDEVQRVLAAL